MKKLGLLTCLLSLPIYAEHAVTPTPMPGHRPVAGAQVAPRPPVDVRCQPTHETGTVSISDGGALAFRAPAPEREGETLLARASDVPQRYVTINDADLQGVLLHMGARTVNIPLPEGSGPVTTMKYALDATGRTLAATSHNGETQYTTQLDEQGNAGPWHRVSFTRPNNFRRQVDHGPWLTQHLIVQNPRSVVSMEVEPTFTADLQETTQFSFRRATPTAGEVNTIRYQVDAWADMPTWHIGRQVIGQPAASPSGNLAAFVMTATDRLTQTEVRSVCIINLESIAAADHFPPPRGR